MPLKKRKHLKRGDLVNRPLPLISARRDDEAAEVRIRKKSSKRRIALENRYIDEDLSCNILKVAGQQRKELPDGTNVPHTRDLTEKKMAPSLKFAVPVLPSDVDASDSSDDDDSEAGVLLEQPPAPLLDEKDVLDFERFAFAAPGKLKSLGEIIAEKIASNEEEVVSQLSENVGCVVVRDIDPQVVEMYRGVGKVLSSYRSGKVPKPFKLIPQLVNWEQMLYFTEPDNWTAAAVYQATRLFASNMNQRMCQRLYNLVLLPRIRDDIAEYKKLNFHLYQALIKALFKPAAFFKGFLLPLCQSGTCSLREATIIGSILSRTSIPMLHASAAMLKIAEMEYSGANSLFLRILIGKVYTLPFQVIDALVGHFLRFMNDKRELPVLWHQSLLALVQHYKSDLSSEQKEALLELIKHHSHYQISSEIRREIVTAVPRDVEFDAVDPSMEL